MSLKPWREVIVPHRNVLEGTFQASEFAADVSQVAAGKAPPEYQDPELFFERTYITEGMRLLLHSVVSRLAGKGGDPVIQLQTAFGGGKTHSMLAAYHLARGERPASALAGVPEILDAAGVTELPKGRVAVLDGHALSPSQPRRHGGVLAHTLWGELAWQLGGEEGYRLVARADQDGTSPGKEDLAALFSRFGPCVILIDETVAYLRQFEEGKRYAGGTFESNLSFVQALTEAVSMTPRAVVLASLPESEVEVGGRRGRQALEALEKYFGRKEAIWKPVAVDEGFEIVRRRLFGPVRDEAARDAVCRAFADAYLQAGNEFPRETQEASYYDRLRAAYPIHPEFFQRLYEDWAPLEKFQRTRGVLRLMAMTIHRLWVDGNRDLLILPGSLPLYDATVKNELLRYLPQGWDPVIDRDVDGPYATPTRIDEKNPLLGEVQAARRAARTIFLGSAPAVAGQRVRGVDISRVRLGCAQPGQAVGRYDDAVRRLRDQLFYLYTGNDRYWYDTRPNLRREMEERMARFHRDQDLIPEIARRLRTLLKGGPFAGVHVFTPHGDLPDDAGLRLVVLPPTRPHKRKDPESLAVEAAAEILTQRGPQPRLNQNRLVFLAADKESTPAVYDETRRYLAWQSIDKDVKPLNLDQLQIGQVKENLEDSDRRLTALVREAFRWVLAPTQEADRHGGLTPVRWEEFGVPAGTDKVMAAIERGAVENEFVIPRWSPFHLKAVLDTWYWRDGRCDVPLKRLWEDFCRYPYLPRLLAADVLRQAVAEGVKGTEFFGYAQGKDDQGAYVGLVLGEQANVYLDDSSLVIELGAARQAKEQEAAGPEPAPAPGPALGPEPGPGTAPGPGPGPGPQPEPKPAVVSRWFHGRVTLDPIEMGLRVADIAQEVVQHFTVDLGTKVTVKLEIEAESPTGFSESLRRIVKTNCDVLKFDFAEFEEE